MLGVANVKIGFSMPPYGKLGGSTSTLYSPQAYGYTIFWKRISKDYAGLGLGSESDLDSIDEFLRVCLQLPFAFIQFVRAGRHHTSGSNSSLSNIPSFGVSYCNLNYLCQYSYSPTRQSEEIDWNRHVLFELVLLMTSLVGSNRFPNR